MSPSVEAFEEALLAMDRLAAERLLRAESAGRPAIERLEQLVAPALERIGRRWEAGDAALAQVYMSGRICEELVSSLLPPGAPERRSQPPVALVVLEDSHALGKRMVRAALQAAGFEIRDFGQGVSADEVVARAQAERIAVLLISTLMLRSALRVKLVAARVRQACPHIRVVVGGAPFLFDPELWREVGANAMGHDASEAVALVKRMLGELSPSP